MKTPLQEPFAHLCSYKLQSLLPSSQGSFLNTPRYMEHEIRSPWLVAGNMQGLQCLPSHSPFRCTCSEHRDLHNGSLKLPGKHSPHTSITLSTKTGSSRPGWHPPNLSLDRCHAWCYVTLMAVLLHLKRRERNPLSLRRRKEKMYSFRRKK